MIESFSINPDREMQLQIRHLGMNQMVRRRLADTVMTKLQPTNENWTGPLFQLFNGMSVVQDEYYPDNRIGLFNEDMVLLGWVQLGGDNEARKIEGVEKCCGGAGKIGI
jgi:hypothetical protein